MSLHIEKACMIPATHTKHTSHLQSPEKEYSHGAMGILTEPQKWGSNVKIIA